MAKIYFYKLTVDDGGAPCVQDDLLSLAICKPMIRKTAERGDILIGFAANSLHRDNRLIYVARVTEKLTQGDYFKNPSFAARKDCIYEWRSGYYVVRPGALYHGTPAGLIHDLGFHSRYSRANTLISREFCYFGASGSGGYKRDFPAVAAAVSALGQGHRVNHSPELSAELGKLARSVCDLKGPCVKGVQTTEPQSGSIRCDGGCVVRKTC